MAIVSQGQIHHEKKGGKKRLQEKGERTGTANKKKNNLGNTYGNRVGTAVRGEMPEENP